MRRQVYPPRERVYPSSMNRDLDIGFACCITQTKIGGYIGVGFKDGSVACLDSDTFGVVYRYRACSMAILALSFNEKGDFLAAVSADMTACLIDLSKLEVAKVIAFDAVPLGASFAPFNVSKFCYYNDSTVFETNFDGSTVQLDLQSEENITYRSIRLLPDNVIVAGTSNGFLHFIQENKGTKSKEITKKLNLGRFAVVKVQYFPNVHILTALCDKSIKICNYGDPRRPDPNNQDQKDAVSSCEVQDSVYFRHVAFEWSCTEFSDDAENVFVASKGLNGKLLLYNANAKIDILELEDHKGVITHMLYDEERSMLVGVSTSGRIYVWTPPRSHTEWSYQIPEFKYNDTMDLHNSTVDDWYVKLPKVTKPPPNINLFSAETAEKDFIIPYQF